MTPYIGCEYARERLESFIDEELSVEEQVAVETHVRWCRTCAARIEDLQLIGASIRVGSSALHHASDVEPAISAVHSRVLMRLRAEREQSLPVRVREQFTDLRLLWPALGATMAVVLCASVAVGVLKKASIERPESLATRLEAMANPGSERNPLRPDNNARVDRYFEKYVDSDRAGGISMPRVLDDGASFDAIQDQEAMFTMATVVSRDGRIANLELLKSERTGTAAEKAVHANDVLVKSGHSTIYSRLVEGRFPKYRDVIPAQAKISIELVVNPFYNAVRQAQIVTNEESRGVDFTFGDGTLVLSGQTAEVGQSRVELPIAYAGPAISITLDPRFVIDFLKVLEPEKSFTLDLQDADGAAVCTTDDGYGYVIMPLARDR